MDIFTLITQRLQELKKDLNERLAKLPPLEQVAAAGEVGWALQSIKDAGERAQRTVDEMLAKIDELPAKVNEMVGAEVQSALQAKKEAGEIVLKADHEEAVKQAEGAKEQAMQQQFDQQRAQEKRVEQQRAALKDGETALPSAFVDALPVEVIAAEDFQSAVLPRVSSRVGELRAIGITDDMVDQMSRAGSFAYDDKGEEAFRGEVKYLAAIFQKEKRVDHQSAPDQKPAVSTPTPTPKPAGAVNKLAAPVC